MKYYVFFHLVDGLDIRATVTSGDLRDPVIQDRLADELASQDFWHFVEDGKFVIVNMRNVAYIRITEAG